MLQKTTLLQDIKTFLSSWFRGLELKSAGYDEEKIRQITEATEDETIRKWLWIISIAGAPVCFLGLPLALTVLSIIFSSFVMQLLWFLTKLAMIAEFGLFGTAIWFTWYLNRKS